MSSNQFPIPPTYTPPFEYDPTTGESDVAPAWLQWFLDVANTFSTLSGIVTGAHNSLSGLQGGTAGQYYHLQVSDYNTLLGGGDASTLHNHRSLTALSGVTPGASPYSVQNTDPVHDKSLIIQGGTVSLLEYTRENATFINLGVVAAMFAVSPGDRIRITYTVAPTVTWVPR